MAEKMLARVAVSSVPYAADKLYTYRVPDELKDTAAPGKRVLIPFGRGNRRSEGFVLDIVREEDKPVYKPILFSTMPRCWTVGIFASCGG